MSQNMASEVTASPAYDEFSPASPQGNEAGIVAPKESYIINGEQISVNKVTVIDSKGDFVAGGLTGIVELLDSGYVMKSPWTGDWREPDSNRDMAIEANVYQRLGAHPRLVPLKHWDPVDYTLTLQYMPHGNLKEYVRKHGHEISPSQRQQWALEAAEGIELLHSHGVVQCDVGPHNFLLDADFSLKICDFAGSSVDGSKPLVCAGVRYRLPKVHGARGYPLASVHEDIFALGSTIYFISTGHEPYEELGDNEEKIEEMFQNGVFPNLGSVLLADVIASCWRQEAKSAQMAVELIRVSSSTAIPDINSL